ncbi:penicillin-binding transpeptidase domain-containing protein [Bacillus sp. HNG]|uniref:penicillin-binding transpeptidase domain-containing protein n=1 Tax=Bacillus sp. HNG TaxID=2293325 RepID=UPI000E2FF12E|nr:penicillin-binding transpeptidase domain-containing protein [Bacillus sp. HNG]RFB17466.1 penicillin-binding transpeptidase domain-containing protein [Bacillus sp. HNG]
MYRNVLLWIILIMVIAFLTSCNNDPKPEDRFQAFISDWEKHDFEKVYSQFSEDVKEKVNKDEFVERFDKIYSDININNLNIDFKAPEEEIEPNEQGEVAFTYDLSMETIAGPVEFSEQATLVLEEEKDEKKWAVRWEHAMFFPDMEEGDEIGLEQSSPRRGEILDRNGVKLAENGLVYEIGMVPEDLGENKEATITKAAELLNTTPESIQKELNASWVQPHYFVPIARLPLEEQELATELTQLSGVLSKKVESRVYPFKEAAAHLIGYIGKVTAEDLKNLEGKGYSANDIVGKKGLEFVLEDRLRGEKGVHLYIKKANGTENVTLAKKEAKDGETIRLTIDIDVQQVAHDQLGGNAGAAAAIHPLTGEALALVSSPSFDPNAFVLGNAPWNVLNEDPLKPLVNRFILTYAPGSTFKPLTAGIALENQVITPETSIDITGKQWQKDSSWGGYSITRVTDPGKPVNLRDAFVYSDNIYFAQAALGIGGERFESELTKYGFGEPFPFEYPVYESKVSNEGLNSDVLTADTGYGQGQLEMSPIHLAVSFTPLLNSGNLIKPKLLLDESVAEPEFWKENVLTPENAKIILDDLVQVVEDPNGTANDAKIEGIRLAGKTGTAELKATKDEDGQENGLFVGFNTENPSLLVAMLIEDVKNGSYDVTPKVKAILESVLR